MGIVCAIFHEWINMDVGLVNMEYRDVTSKIKYEHTEIDEFFFLNYHDFVYDNLS